MWSEVKYKGVDFEFNMINKSRNLKQLFEVASTF